MAENGSPFDFPCDVPVKVFGRSGAGFREAVLDIARRHFPALDDSEINERPSRQDRYLSITLTVRAESRAQLDALYTELSAHDAILMLL